MLCLKREAVGSGLFEISLETVTVTWVWLLTTW